MNETGLDTQAKLAEAAGVSAKVISNVLTPTGPSPTLTTIQSIADALGVPPWELLMPAEDPDDVQVVTDVLSVMDVNTQKKIREYVEQLARETVKPTKKA